MPTNSGPEGAPAPQRWVAAALIGVLALTLWRVVALALTPMDLFVDEAQYWFWGQELALGYYSKPPLIGWLIRAVTDLAGSDAAFWVRLPAPILHGVSALGLGAIAARHLPPGSAFWVCMGYATLPLVAVGSTLMSTDTVMFPLLVLALGLYLNALQAPGPIKAALIGGVIGLAFLAKYAAVYYLLCGALAMVWLPGARLPRAHVAILLIGFTVAISPNLLWNLWNGFSTFSHTLDNADWVRAPGERAGVNPASLATFVAAQVAVFGPVAFGAFLVLVARGRAQPVTLRILLTFAVPILVIVCFQALVSQAYANWAAAAYLAASLAVFSWMGPRWRRLSLALNGAVAVALPLAVIFADTLTLGSDRLVMARYIGRADLSARVIAAARAQDTVVVVSPNRDILADLFYSGRDSGLAFFATPAEARAPHHYALKHPLPGDAAGPVLFVTSDRRLPDCATDVAPVAVLTPEAGAYRGKRITLMVLPTTCWTG